MGSIVSSRDSGSFYRVAVLFIIPEVTWGARETPLHSDYSQKEPGREKDMSLTFKKVSWDFQTPLLFTYLYESTRTTITKYHKLGDLSRSN